MAKVAAARARAPKVFRGKSGTQGAKDVAFYNHALKTIGKKDAKEMGSKEAKKGKGNG